MRTARGADSLRRDTLYFIVLYAPNRLKRLDLHFGVSLNVNPGALEMSVVINDRQVKTE